MSRTSQNVSACLCLALSALGSSCPGQSPALSQPLSFEQPPKQGDSSGNVSGPAGAKFWVVSVSPGSSCSDNSANEISAAEATLNEFGKATVQYKGSLPTNTVVCIVGTQQGSSAGSKTSLISAMYLTGSPGGLLSFVQKPLQGDVSVTIQGTPSVPGGATYTVTLAQLLPGASRTLVLTSDGSHLQCDLAQTEPIAVKSGSKSSISTDPTTGQATFTLANPLQLGNWLCAYQSLESGTTQVLPLGALGKTQVEPVADPLDWGRARAYVAGGVLLANDNSAFSTAHQFYLFNYDKAWLLPDAYALGPKNLSVPVWARFGYPGVDTYFEAKLTAIPVATNNPATSSTTSSSGSSSSSSSGGSSSNTFLTSQKTASVAAGAYLPFLATRWIFDGQRYAFSIAPIAKVGFNTLAAPTTQNIPVPNGSGTTAASFEQVYNFYSYGGRILDYRLGMRRNHQPYVVSYFDVTWGRYSNLPSYICVGSATKTPYSGSSCGQYFPPAAGSTSTPAYDALKRLYRIDLEGTLVVPKLDVFIGFNANIGQHSFGATHLDTAFQPPDDVRFVFGYKTDLATVLKKLGVPISDN